MVKGLERPFTEVGLLLRAMIPLHIVTPRVPPLSTPSRYLCWIPGCLLRLSKPDDTTLSIGLESDQTPQMSWQRGRRVQQLIRSDYGFEEITPRTY